MIRQRCKAWHCERIRSIRRMLVGDDEEWFDDFFALLGVEGVLRGIDDNLADAVDDVPAEDEAERQFYHK